MERLLSSVSYSCFRTKISFPNYIKKLLTARPDLCHNWLIILIASRYIKDNASNVGCTLYICGPLVHRARSYIRVLLSCIHIHALACTHVAVTRAWDHRVRRCERTRAVYMYTRKSAFHADTVDCVARDAYRSTKCTGVCVCVCKARQCKCNRSKLCACSWDHRWYWATERGVRGGGVLNFHPLFNRRLRSRLH